MEGRPLRIAFDLSATRLGQAGVARTALQLADALDDLSRSLGLLWGVLPSGEVWLGQPPWDAAPEFDADHLEEDGVYQTRTYEIRAFGPLPGQTLDGRRLGCCRYTARDKQGTRLQVWFTVDGSSLDGDPVRGGLRDLIRETVPLSRGNRDRAC